MVKKPSKTHKAKKAAIKVNGEKIRLGIYCRRKVLLLTRFSS